MSKQKAKAEGDKSRAELKQERKHMPPELALIWNELKLEAAARGLKVERTVVKHSDMPDCFFYRIAIGPVGKPLYQADGTEQKSSAYTNVTTRVLDGDRMEAADLPAARRRYIRAIEAVRNYAAWRESYCSRGVAAGASLADRGSSLWN